MKVSFTVNDTSSTFSQNSEISVRVQSSPLSSAFTAILEKLDSKPMLKTLKLPEFRWPVVGDGLGGEYQWSAGQWSLLKTLADMRNLHSKSVLIRLYVSPDDKNSSHYVIKVRRARPVSDMRLCSFL